MLGILRNASVFLSKTAHNFVVATLLQARANATRRCSRTHCCANSTEALLGVSYRWLTTIFPVFCSGKASRGIPRSQCSQRCCEGCRLLLCNTQQVCWSKRKKWLICDADSGFENRYVSQSSSLRSSCWASLKCFYAFVPNALLSSSM